MFTTFGTPRIMLQIDKYYQHYCILHFKTIIFIYLQVKEGPTKVQEQFQRDLASSCKKLLKAMGVTDEEAVTHRICDLEVIELNNEVGIGFALTLFTRQV